MAARFSHIYELAEEHQPASVRHIFYQSVVHGVPGITKDVSGYNKVQRALAEMRIDGRLPFSWIVDNTRWVRRITSYSDARTCLTETARMYRRNLWADADVTLEVWCESDSIAGVLHDVTYRWGVDLMVTRGYSSLTFSRSAVESWNATGRPVVVYYIGDHDPYGLGIEDKMIEYIRAWTDVAVSWERIGVTWEQVEQYYLPGTTPKRPYGFPLAVEAEALPPGLLRGLLDDAIASHVDPDELQLHELVESEERHLLLGLPAMLEGRSS